MDSLDYAALSAACTFGGSSALTFTTPLAPAAGPMAAIAPARFLAAKGGGATYGFSRRFHPESGRAVDAVTIDSKGSSLNRVEAAHTQAILDQDGPLALTPHIQVTYPDREPLLDSQLPHRMVDAHIRSGTVHGLPVVHHEKYQAARNATAANMRAVLELSPISLGYGMWDAHRKSHQLRLRSILTGETFGILADQDHGRDIDPRGGARVDPVGASMHFSASDVRDIMEPQFDEISPERAKAIKGAKSVTSGSSIGLGAIPPTLSELGYVACSEIVRYHIISFTTLRQLRFGLGREGDIAARALLAAMLLDALVRSYAELSYRAGCDVVESDLTRVIFDGRGGVHRQVTMPRIEDADALLDEAVIAARRAGVMWDGEIFRVDGNPSVIHDIRDAEESE